MKRTLLLVVLFSVLIFTGCSTKTINLDYINNYKEITELNQKKNSKTVYIIRDNYFLGNSGREFFVECNNKRYRIYPSEYISCNIEKETNTISYGRIAAGFLNTSLFEGEHLFPTLSFSADESVDNEEFFLLKPGSVFIDPKDEFIKLDDNVGMTYVGDPAFKLGKNINNYTKGNGYDLSLLNPSSIYFNNLKNNGYSNQTINNDNKKTTVQLNKNEKANILYTKSLMKVSNQKETKVDKSTSRIIIFRKNDNKNLFLGIWNDKNYMGSLSENSFIEINTREKNMNFYTLSAELFSLPVSLEKGKTYFIEIDFNMGLSDDNMVLHTNKYILLNLSNEKTFKEVKESLIKIERDNNKINKSLELRIKEGIKFIHNNK